MQEPSEFQNIKNLDTLISSHQLIYIIELIKFSYHDVRTRTDQFSQKCENHPTPLIPVPN
jgi:hypothetical protein